MTAPTLNGRDIGQAEKATRAVFDVLLAEAGTTFLLWVPLNLVADNGAKLLRDQLVTRLVNGLKISEREADEAVDALVGSGLAMDEGGSPDAIELTPAGEVQFRRVSGDLDRLAERLYGDLPLDDLATAKRVLATVTERANAELRASP